MSSPEQLPLGFQSLPAFGEPDFVVSGCNREAVRWLDLWPDWPSPLLAIHGPAASGKTHLCHVFRSRTGALMLRGDALDETSIELALEKPAAILVDDAHLVAGDSEAERRFFHLYNIVNGVRGALFTTGPQPPNLWPVRLPDLRSRLATAMVSGIDLPDDELLSVLIVKQFADRQLRAPDEVVSFIVRRMERSFEAARTIVDRVDRAALAGRRNITLPLVREVLEGAFF